MEQAFEDRQGPGWYAPHANSRADSYVLLAALLTDAPSRQLLALVKDLAWDEGLPERTERALAALNRVANHRSEQVIGDEFNRLFVGLGSGELVPYGSWYLEKTIQSAPLAAIRSDLRRLGIVRQAESFESEDHAGALCEIMALLSAAGNGVALGEQAAFFGRHLAPWMFLFFNDLRSVQNAVFYQAVGNYGSCFLEAESDYLDHCEEKADEGRRNRTVPAH